MFSHIVYLRTGDKYQTLCPVEVTQCIRAAKLIITTMEVRNKLYQLTITQTSIPE